MNRTQVKSELVRAGFKRDRSSKRGTVFHKPIGRKGWRLSTLVSLDLEELQVTLQLDGGRARGTLFCIKSDVTLADVLAFIDGEAKRLLADDERLLKCPHCMQFMSVQRGPDGLFLGCDNWPTDGKREPWHCEGRADGALVPAQRVWQ